MLGARWKGHRISHHKHSFRKLRRNGCLHICSIPPEPQYRYVLGHLLMANALVCFFDYSKHQDNESQAAVGWKPLAMGRYIAEISSKNTLLPA